MARKATKNPKTIPCPKPDCKMMFCRVFTMTRHVKTIHDGIKIPCPWEGCDAIISQQGNLNIHYRIHTGEKPYPCSVCGKSFNSGAGRDHHRTSHLPKKPKASKKVSVRKPRQKRMKKAKKARFPSPTVVTELGEDRSSSQSEELTLVGSPGQGFHTLFSADGPPQSDDVECAPLAASPAQDIVTKGRVPIAYEDRAVVASSEAQEWRWAAPSFSQAFGWVDDPLYVPMIPPPSMVLHLINLM